MHRLAAGLLVGAGTWHAVRAAVHTVSCNDNSINYVGSGWTSGTFAIRNGIDPPGDSGTNDTTCAFGQPSLTTNVIGNSLTYAFSGVDVQLVTESGDDYGVFNVTVDSITLPVDGFSTGLHCGVSFDSGPLGAGSHVITVTLAAPDPSTKLANPFFSLMSLIIDDGITGSSGSSTPAASSTPPASSTKAHDGAPSSTGLATPSPQSSSNTGAIAGGVIAGLAVLVGLALAVYFTLLRRRRARQHDSASAPAMEQREHLVTPWQPTPSAPSSGSGNGAQYYNNATSYYPSEPSNGAPSEYRDASSRGAGPLHDADVERIAERLAGIITVAPAPEPAASMPRTKETYVVPQHGADGPSAAPGNHGVARAAEEDEPPPAY